MAYYQNTSTLFARSRQIGEANNLNQAGDVAQVQGSDFKPQYHKQKEREGRGGEGREREGREGKGREGKGREGKGREGKGRDKLVYFKGVEAGS
jgi:hypothetical protein